MPRDQLLMGIAMIAICLLGLWHDRWFLLNTKKGQRFVRWFGEQKGLWVLRLLLGGGVLFGVLLATDVIRPVQW